MDVCKFVECLKGKEDGMKDYGIGDLFWGVGMGRKDFFEEIVFKLNLRSE